MKNKCQHDDELIDKQVFESIMEQMIGNGARLKLENPDTVEAVTKRSVVYVFKCKLCKRVITEQIDG